MKVRLRDSLSVPILKLFQKNRCVKDVHFDAHLRSRLLFSFDLKNAPKTEFTAFATFIHNKLYWKILNLIKAC